jgi:hypothetical protein
MINLSFSLRLGRKTDPGEFDWMVKSISKLAFCFKQNELNLIFESFVNDIEKILMLSESI